MGRIGHGLRASIRNNASAYAYSVVVTATFAGVQLTEGSPHAGDLFAFVLGAGVAFAGAEAAASRGFRARIRPDPAEVVVLGSAISPVSMGAAVGAGYFIGSWLSGWLGWAGGSFSATLTYLLLDGLQMAFARRAQENREPEEEEGEDGDEAA